MTRILRAKADADLWRSGVGQGGVAWAGVEEETENGREEDNPGPGEWSDQEKKEQGKSCEHAEGGNEKVTAGEFGAQAIAGDSAGECGDEAGDDEDGTKDGSDKLGLQAALGGEISGHPETNAADGEGHCGHGGSVEEIAGDFEEDFVVSEGNFSLFAGVFIGGAEGDLS